MHSELVHILWPVNDSLHWAVSIKWVCLIFFFEFSYGSNYFCKKKEGIFRLAQWEVHQREGEREREKNEDEANSTELAKQVHNITTTTTITNTYNRSGGGAYTGRRTHPRSSNAPALGKKKTNQRRRKSEENDVKPEQSQFVVNAHACIMRSYYRNFGYSGSLTTGSYTGWVTEFYFQVKLHDFLFG